MSRDRHAGDSAGRSLVPKSENLVVVDRRKLNNVAVYTETHVIEECAQPISKPYRPFLPAVFVIAAISTPLWQHVFSLAPV